MDSLRQSAWSTVNMGIALLLCAGTACVAHAQAPGSSQYNSVVLPAHGRGDTRGVGELQSRWGAYSEGEPDQTGAGTTGFSFDQPSREEAVRAANEHCTMRGGINCAVNPRSVSLNTCTVITTGPGRGHRFDHTNLARARRFSLRRCGEGCRVLWEGCSLPVLAP